MTANGYNRFWNSVTCELWNAMKTYDKLLLNVRNDVNKTLSIIYKIIQPDYKSNFIDSIMFNNEPLKDHSSIADTFNEYFSSIGSNI